MGKRAYDFRKKRLGIGDRVYCAGDLGTVVAIPHANVIAVRFDELPSTRVIRVTAERSLSSESTELLSRYQIKKEVQG
jgi:hypothetical protein